MKGWIFKALPSFYAKREWIWSALRNHIYSPEINYFFFSKGWSVGRLHSDQRQDVSTSELHLYPDRYAHEAALGSNMYTCHVSWRGHAVKENDCIVTYSALAEHRYA